MFRQGQRGLASGAGVCAGASIFVARSAADQGRVIRGQVREQAGEIKTQDKHQPKGCLPFGPPAWSAMPKGQGSKEQGWDHEIPRALWHHLDQEKQESLIVFRR